MKIVIVVLLLVLSGCSTVQAQYTTLALGKANGITTANKDIPDWVYDREDIDCIVYRFTWEYLQPDDMNHTKWAELESRIERAAAAGKCSSLKFFVGYYTPNWVYDKTRSRGGQILTMIDEKFGGQFDYAFYGDKSYRWQLWHFLEKVANRVNEYPEVKYVGIPGPSLYSPEMHLFKNPSNKQALIDAGHTTQRLVNEWMDIIDHCVEVFRPDIQLVLHVTIPMGDVDAFNQIVDYAVSQGVTLQGNWLKWDTNTSWLPYVRIQNSPAPKGFQFARPQFDNLDTAVQKGLDAGAEYFEFYVPDLR